VPEKIALTDIAVRKIRPPQSGQLTYWDKSSPVGMRVSSGGARCFIVLTGSGKRQMIGHYPIISLSEARTKAKRILAEKTLGKTRSPSMLYDEARTLFLSHCEQHKRPLTTHSYKRLLTSHFPFGRMQLTDISPQEVLKRIDRLKGTPAEQSHALVAFKVFMSWCVKRYYIPQNPCQGMTPTAKAVSRDRVLSNQELKTILETALNGEDNFSRILSLLILMGQRRGETGALKWEYINETDRTITFPASITKNKRAHTFPYGDTGMAIIDSTPRFSEYLFPASREHVRGKPTTSFNGWPKCKAAFDEKCGISNWTLHDLRRTFATKLAALGTPIHVTEKLLNHVSGTTGGLVAVYQRHAYFDEMRDAIEMWEQHLKKLLA
jgi:integrase